MSFYNFLTGRSRDFKKVFMGSEEGQRVLADLYKLCGMNKQVFVPGDEHATSFQAGSHRIGQAIQGILEQDEAGILEVLKHQRSGTATNNGSFDPFNTEKVEKD